MTEYLVLTLSATIAAMGDLAGHERRGTCHWPGRSAITGLLGAALGLRRDDDFAAIDELGMAVAMFNSAGEAGFRDYHTVETIPTAKARHPNSRPQALRTARGKTNTTITLRDYRTGFLCGVALWGGSLEPLHKALLHPRYALYLGRKSCPLSAPVAPRRVSAGSAQEALSQVQVPAWRGRVAATQMMTDATADDEHVELRHDMAVDRKHWHFAPRRVAIRPVNIACGGAQ